MECVHQLHNVSVIFNRYFNCSFDGNCLVTHEWGKKQAPCRTSKRSKKRTSHAGSEPALTCQHSHHHENRIHMQRHGSSSININ